MVDGHISNVSRLRWEAGAFFLCKRYLGVICQVVKNQHALKGFYNADRDLMQVGLFEAQKIPR